MYQVVFMGYIKKLVGIKSLLIPEQITQLGPLLEHIASNYPILRSKIEDYDISIIIGQDIITLPNNSRLIDSDVYISAIIAGG